MAPITHRYETRHKHKVNNTSLSVPTVQPPAQPAQRSGTKTQQQAKKDRIAGRINKAWPIPKNRKNKVGRGIVNAGTDCYQNSVLQTLMHLPKFMNWIKTHNTRGKKGQKYWPCMITDDCPTCNVKNFIEAYWGQAAMNEDRTERKYFTDGDAALEDVRHRAYAYYNEHSKYNPYSSEAPRNEKGQFRHDQQDAEDLFVNLLGDLKTSTHTLDEAANRALEEYNALFEVELNRRRFCKCGSELQSITDSAGALGFTSLTREEPLKKGKKPTDTVQKLIERYAKGEEATVNLDGETCPGCQKVHNVDVQSRFEIVAGPEYLRVVVPNLDWRTIDAYGSPQKRRDHVAINMTLDLTHLQQDASSPLQYRLATVIRHMGESMQRGHYIADVTGYGRETYTVNDREVERIARKQITDNPTYLEGSDDRVGAYVLVYQRVRDAATAARSN